MDDIIFEYWKALTDISMVSKIEYISSSYNFNIKVRSIKFKH